MSLFEAPQRSLLASSGRDRSIQIFERVSEEVKLVQTLDDHVGAVNGISFSEEGQKLLSISSDRTVIMRESITGSIQGKHGTAYVPIKTINLKSTPLSLALSSESDGSFAVSTADKHVFRYALHCGSLLASFKVNDQDEGESVNLSRIVQLPCLQGPLVIGGVAGADKSIRLYDESGRLLGRDYGHTEGLSGITVVRDPNDEGKVSLVTVSTDGSIFIWDLRLPSDRPGAYPSPLNSPVTAVKNASLANRPPLRRVISSAELVKLQGSQEHEGRFVLPARRDRSQSPKRKPPKLSILQPPLLDAGQRHRESRSEPPTDDMDPEDAEGQHSSHERTASPTSTNRSKKAQTLPRSLRRQSSFPTTSLECAETTARNKRMNQTRKACFGSGSGSSGSTSANTAYNAQITKTNGGTNSLKNCTMQICRSLHTFRRRLNTSAEVLPMEEVKELEKELTLTARALADKVARKSETVMVGQLLNQYSERIVDMLDEKIKGRVREEMEKRVNQERACDERGEGRAGNREAV